MQTPHDHREGNGHAGSVKVFELCLSTRTVYSEEGNCQPLFVQSESTTMCAMALGLGSKAFITGLASK